MVELDPRYRIRAPLRCDGIGRLDCAEDAESGARLAVRWVPLEANGELAVKACEKLPVHPTLPRILQTGQVGTSAFVALDFPKGETLAARGEERLDNEALLKLAAQLSDALATVHAQSVVHGELSRDSVLLTVDGRAVLWDMPLVIANRLADRRGESRLMQNLVKTAPYLSPERARGDGASPASDVYALGALLCVAGGAPLPTASTTLAAVHLVASGGWTPRVPDTLPEAWREMLTKMVSADAAARPGAADVALAFARVPGQGALPTVPELPAVRLPAAIIEAADAAMKSQAEAMRAPTRELSLNEVQAAAAASVDLTPVEPRLALPLAVDPVPELNLAPVAAAKEAEVVTAEVAAPTVTAELPKAAEVVTAEIAPPTVTAEVPKAEPETTPHPFMRAALHAAEAPQPRTSSSDAVPATTEAKGDAAHPFLRSAMHARSITGDGVIEAVGDTRPHVRIPTVEFEAVRDSVPLNDGIAVSAELVAAGAATVSEVDAAVDAQQQRRVWVMFGAFAGAALALVMVVVFMANQRPAVVVTPAPAAAAPVVVAPPVVELDELHPLPNLAPRKVARRAPQPAAPVTPAAPTPAVVEPAPVEAAPAPAPAAPTFEFLEGAEAPKDELKRPEL